LSSSDSLLVRDEWVSVADSVYAARRAAARGERYLLGALADALRIRLRTALREDRGGVYGVGVGASVDRFLGTYAVSIGFGCDPERVDELTAAVFEVIEQFKQEGPEDALDKVKEADRRQQQLAQRENQAWLGALAAAYRYGEAPMAYLDKTDLIDELSDGALRGAAQYYLDLDRYVQVVLLPSE
jgi:zinc protease